MDPTVEKVWCRRPKKLCVLSIHAVAGQALPAGERGAGSFLMGLMFWLKIVVGAASQSRVSSGRPASPAWGYYKY
jgi:hypothetical protein